MPRINIYEHSETYSFQTKNNSYATVAFPIAATWGPTFVEGNEDLNPDWVHFSAGYRGTTDFMQTFRGPNSYLGSREKSFDYALKLLASGYDILVKRVDGLGNKSHNGIFLTPVGVSAPTPANAYVAFKPQSMQNVTYAKCIYRFLLPHVVNHKVEWNYEYEGSDSVSISPAITGRAYNAETGKWVADTRGNMFRVQTKSTSSNESVTVAIGKPTIITTQERPAVTQISIVDPHPTDPSHPNIVAPVRQVTVQGSVPISVYATDGTLLERRNLNITETTQFIGSGAAVNSRINVESVSVPEFTYIQILQIPPLLSLKAAYDNMVSNLFSSNGEDVKYGLITLKVGQAYNALPAMAATATASGSGVSSATVEKFTFSNAVLGTSGSYVFKYVNGSWTLEGQPVSLDKYGITANGSPASNDTITVAFTYGTISDITIASGGAAAVIDSSTPVAQLQAKYPGSYGNNLKVRIRCGLDAEGYKVGTVEVFDNNGYNNNPTEIVSTDQLLELVSVAFDEHAANDNRPIITEATFSNLDTPKFVLYSDGSDVAPSNYPTGVQVVSLLYGTDFATAMPDGSSITVADITGIVRERFSEDSPYYTYIDDIAREYAANDNDALIRLYNQQIMYKRFQDCVGELTDPIVYDWDALVQGIADDQYVPKSYQESHPEFYMDYYVSTLVTKMVEVAANSKCGAALIGTPFGMSRGIQTGTGAATVKTGALLYKDMISQAVGSVYSTFGEIVGPWCKTTLAYAGANAWIAPEVAHLLLIINAKGVGGQNKWWMVPAGMLGTGIVHSPEYKIKRKYLDLIQDHDQGVCLNPLMEVPGKGFTCFGNSTLWDKPLGTYNALQNLSTRFLTNRVKQRIWDTALQILFKYNNEDAYSHFYAGLSPLLDEMRAVGALTGNDYNPWGYRIVMNPDIINLDRINANTVIGKVELAVTGVIDTVDVDLFLLPPTGFQETYD